MKAKLTKCLIAGILVVNVMGVIPVSAMPLMEISAVEAPITRADVLEYYYRINNEILQVRIWNATRGYWMGDWKDV